MPACGMFQPDMEIAYMRSNKEKLHVSLTKVSFVMGLIFISDIVTLWINDDYNPSASSLKLALGCATLVVLVILAVVVRSFVQAMLARGKDICMYSGVDGSGSPRQLSGRLNDRPCCATPLYCHVVVVVGVIAAGSCWAAYCAVEPRSVISGGPGVVVFLVIVSSLGSLLYPVSLRAFVVIGVVGIVGLVITQVMQSYMWITDMVTIIIGIVVLCIFNFKVEWNNRSLFALQRELHSKIQEMNALKERVFIVTMEKHNVMDENQHTIAAPVEEAMRILSRLHNLDNMTQVVLEAQKVMEILGNGGDIYRPSLNDELKRIEATDEDKSYLMSMLQATPSGLYFNRDKYPPRHSQTFRRANTGSILVIPKHGSHGSLGRVTKLQSFEILEEKDNFGIAPELLASPAVDQQLLQSMRPILDGIDEWDFSVFALCDQMPDEPRPLFYLGVELFQRYDLIKKFSIPMDKFYNFLMAAEQGYLENAYHNSTHAADVARSAYYFLTQGKIGNCCTDIELMAMLFASLIHDYGHPGYTNQYYVATRNPLAIHYNDQHVLEMMHVAESFKLLFQPQNNFLREMERADFDVFRQLVIDLVLATDMAHHLTYLTKFRTTLSSASTLPTDDPKVRLVLLQIVLKCSDIGHAAKEHAQHVKWTERIQTEFFNQGDLERQQKLHSQPHMNREKANVPKSQIGFFKFVVIPLFSPLLEYLKQHSLPCKDRLHSNLEYWTSLLEKDNSLLDSSSSVNKKNDITSEKSKSKSSRKKVEPVPFGGSPKLKRKVMNGGTSSKEPSAEHKHSSSNRSSRKSKSTTRNSKSSAATPQTSLNTRLRRSGSGGIHGLFKRLTSRTKSKSDMGPDPGPDPTRFSGSFGGGPDCSVRGGSMGLGPDMSSNIEMSGGDSHLDERRSYSDLMAVAVNSTSSYNLTQSVSHQVVHHATGNAESCPLVKKGDVANV